MNAENQTNNLDQLSDLAQDHLIQNTRVSKQYIATMSDIVNSLNKTNINELNGIELEELKAQSGNLAYFTIKNAQNPVPCDIDYFRRLYSHLRRPLLLMLKRIKKNLTSANRRELSTLERESALEKLIKPRSYDVNFRIKTASMEMRRYRKMSNLVKGGGRKLDILFQCIKIPARIRSEILILFRIMADQSHPKNVEAINWLRQSEHQGDFEAFQQFCIAKIELLENQAESTFDLIEDLSGLRMNRDLTEIDFSQNWYTLGQATARGEDFVSSFHTDELREDQIKRLTFTMVRIGWDADRITAEKDRILLEKESPEKKVECLSQLFFDIQKRVKNSTGLESEVVVAIESDYERHLLSNSEYKQAFAWVTANKVKLKELLLDIYAEINSLKEANPDLVIPPELDTAIESIQNSMDEDKESQKKKIGEDIDQLDLGKIEADFEALLAKKEEDPLAFLKEMHAFSEKVSKQKNFLSIKNIDFHRRLRESYENFEDYENKVMELMKLEEGLEEIRVKIETCILEMLENLTFARLTEPVHTWLVNIKTNQLLLSIKRCDYEPINAKAFRSQMKTILTKEKEEVVAHLDFLLQIIQTIPKAHQLLSALKDWEKDLKAEEYNEKKALIESNDEALQSLTEEIRNELRESLGQSNYQNRRIRFEVFGFADYYSTGLENTFKSLMELADRAANIKELEQILTSVKALENQVIEAQKSTREHSEARKKLDELLTKEVIDQPLLKQLEADLDENFHELNRLLPKLSAGLKKLVLMQNRYGADKESDYLDITINIEDVDKLKELYDFIDEATLEDIKRFCVSYNLRQSMMEGFFEMARKKDVSIPKELQKQVSSKVYKNFKEKRYIPASLKYQVYLFSKEIFESEMQLLSHTLNLVKPHRIQNKAAFKNMVVILSGAKEAPSTVVKKLGLLWGRTQSRLFKHKPVNHQRNYEGNRTSLVNIVKEEVGEKFELQL